MTVMTAHIPRQRTIARHAAPRPEPVPTPWWDLLWIVPLAAVVAAVVLVVGCWIVDLLGAVDFGTANTLATLAAGAVTCVTTWRWFL